MSAGEGEEAVLLPAVGHDLLGPDLPLSAVGAEVDAVLVMVHNVGSLVFFSEPLDPC